MEKKQNIDIRIFFFKRNDAYKCIKDDISVELFNDPRDVFLLASTALHTWSGSHSVIPGFTGFYWILLGFTGF